MANETEIDAPGIRWFRMLLAFTLFAVAVLCRWRAAPAVSGIPSDFSAEYHFNINSESRDSPNSLWRSSEAEMERVDQVLIATGDVRLIQGDLQVYLKTGAVLFEQTGLFGVDSTSMKHQAGYGNISRTGYYYFPPNTSKRSYDIWDVKLAGPHTAEFVREEHKAGTLSYVFRFAAKGIEETDGYRSLPGVPDLYLALTDAHGTMQVDSVSGVMIDYEETGISYFVDVNTRERVADFHRWHASFTPSTRSAQRLIAQNRRTLIYTARIIVPAFLVSVAAFLLVTSILRRPVTLDEEVEAEAVSAP